MNIGIITIHNHFNYGAVLQAYALNRTIHKMGHQCKTIDCDIEPGTGRRLRRSIHPGEQIKNIYFIFHWAANKRYLKHFHDFGQHYIPTTNIIYKTLDQLVSSPPKFDAYITGSDQVWHPLLLDRQIGDAFHLCFASPDRSRLIAYAPSFGVTEIPNRHLEKIRNYLLRYHTLSTREKRGQEIIFELTGKEAKLVLDPTLLLSAEEYEPIVPPSTNSAEYLLVYPMEVGKNMGFLRLVKEVKKRLSLPVVCVFPLSFDYRWLMIADKVMLDAGPMEFLGLFKNASFICTNSFHGTAFSIIYRKNFLGVPHSGTNSRIYSLLDKVGLLDRQLNDSSPPNVQNSLERSIDYNAVIPQLQDGINQSLEYLRGALQ
jgi:hypothetical protein